MEIQLTKDQQSKYEGIKWLTDPMGPRGSGRTYLLALSFISHAIYYGMWINIYNHDTHPQSIREIVNQIERIVHGMVGIKFQIRNMHERYPAIRIIRIEEPVYIITKE